MGCRGHFREPDDLPISHPGKELTATNIYDKDISFISITLGHQAGLCGKT